MSSLATLRVLLEMAVRNIGAHWVKSLIVGSLLAFGTFLVVMGGAILDSISASMEESITSSLAGHVQVYSEEAKDGLELFGGTGMGSADLGEIAEWGPVREALLEVEHVEHVVPMGITQAVVFGKSELDRVLEGLDEAIDTGDVETRDTLFGHLQTIVTTMRDEVASQGLAASDEETRADLAAVDRVLDPSFAEWLQEDPQAAMVFLDTRIAPLSLDGRLFYLRCIGTDLEQFEEVFDRFRIVEGQHIPEGRRGILLSHRLYEMQAKNTVARALDALGEDLDDGAVIAGDATLENRVRSTADQYRRVLFQVPPDELPALVSELRTAMGDAAPDSDDPAEVLRAFLLVDDDNFRARYEAFYEHIAPRITLYELPVGGIITLRGFTKSGYMRAINVRVWGTYEFAGLEKSDIAGASNLVDLVTFRSLYGKMTEADKAELADIRAEAGIVDVSREDAEAALFGEGGMFDSVERTVDAEPVDEAPPAPVDADDGDDEEEDQLVATLIDDRVYTRDEMVEGMVINAAVVLDDPTHIPQVLAAIGQASDSLGLGVQAVDWQTAAGIVGQMTLVLQGVMLVAIFVIFLVTLVIINNTMVMATMERTTEIGTFRAIGAQRHFVILLFAVETVILGLVAGAVGSVAAVVLVSWLGSVGIPAVEDVLVLLFAGPRLYPSLTAGNVVVGIVVVVAISLLSTLYPSVLAARVQPVVAMRGKE